MNRQCHLKAICWEQIEQMETWGNCVRFWYGKCIKWVKNLFSCELFVLLSGKISYAGTY
jgi:hypothetical protein